MEKVYEFWYNECIHEGSNSCVSIHRTRKGAEMAMEFHKDNLRKMIEDLYEDEEDMDFTFDDMGDWGINERELFE